MLKPLFLSALLFFIPGILWAKDPVRFFDGPAHGWKIIGSTVDYDLQGRAVFIGYGDKFYYVYDILSSEKKIIKKFYDISSNKMIPEYHDSWMYPKILSHSNYFDYSSFYEKYISRYKIYKDEDNYDNLWFVLVVGKKKIKDGWGMEARSDYDHELYYTYFDHYRGIRLDFDGNIYIYSSENGFFYRIPHEMRRKIVIRERLIYAPLRFLVKAWDRLPLCPNRKKVDYARAKTQQNCLDAIFRSLPKGDYDADTPYPIPVKR
jgi:hypothetical protein